MSASKRPSTSSLRRFITSRPYIPIAEIRRRFGIDEPDCICSIRRNGSSAFVGLPEREARKVEELWIREEIGVELSLEVRAPVVVGVYPMRIARYVMDGQFHPSNGFHPHQNGNGQAQADADAGEMRRPEAAVSPDQSLEPTHPSNASVTH